MRALYWLILTINAEMTTHRMVRALRLEYRARALAAYDHNKREQHHACST